MKVFELWLVSDVEDVNKLLNVGWEFLQVVYRGTEVRNHGLIRTKTVGAMNVPKYLMVRKDDRILPREHSWEDVSDYIKRVEEKAKE